MYLIKGDNWRERGLDMMMAGRLEANAEEELFKVKERERERERGNMPFLTIIYL